MAKITYVGQLGSTGVSSGPHLHAYVKNLTTGEYEDPGIHRSKFTNVRVGEKRVPKYIQDKSGQLILNPAAGLTMTSPWGPRNTGIKGASKYHRGRDYAGAEGTPIFVEGDVKYRPVRDAGGYGNLATWTTGDGRYELGYGHMKSLGEATDLTNTSVTPDPGTTPPSDKNTLAKSMLDMFVLGLGVQRDKQPDFKEQLFSSLFRQAAVGAESPITAMMKQSIMQQSPYSYLGIEE